MSGTIAWIATCTSPSNAFYASLALQLHKEDPLIVLISAHQAFTNARTFSLATFKNILLDNQPIHLRLFADACFHNLRRKHSHLGFIIFLADRFDKVNIIHLHSSRAPLHAHSTEQSELMALYLAFRSLENITKLVCAILDRYILVFGFVDCNKLWTKLTNDTVPNIGQIGYRFRKAITEKRVYSICLIPSTRNPADAFTKAETNNGLRDTRPTNILRTLPKRVFMFQNCECRH